MKTGLYLGDIPIGKIIISGGGTESADINLQVKTITPSLSQQIVKPSSGYDGLSQVVVEPMQGNFSADQISVADNKIIFFSGGIKINASLGNFGQATAAEVRQGKTFTSSAGLRVSGTMEEATLNAPTITLDNFTGEITAETTITEGYANAGSISNTFQLETQGGRTITPGTSDKTIAAGLYLTGQQTIKGDSNLIPENIVSGKTIFGVAGEASTGSYNSATASQSDILSGTKAYIQSGLVSGSMPRCSANNMTVDGLTVRLSRTGYYTSGTEKTVSVNEGSLSSPEIQVDDDGTITATSEVSTSGYIYEGTTASTSTSLPAPLFSLSKSGSFLRLYNDNSSISYCSPGLQTNFVATNLDSNLIASNIKKDVSIFGITGTYTGSTSSTNKTAVEFLTVDTGSAGMTTSLSFITSSAFATISSITLISNSYYVYEQYPNYPIIQSMRLEIDNSDNIIDKSIFSMNANYTYETDSSTVRGIEGWGFVCNSGNPIILNRDLRSITLDIVNEQLGWFANYYNVIITGTKN